MQSLNFMLGIGRTVEERGSLDIDQKWLNSCGSREFLTIDSCAEKTILIKVFVDENDVLRKV